jgi:signal transduction histidine kinase
LGIYAALVGVLIEDALTLPIPVHIAIGWSFVGAGIVAIRRSPGNRTGLLMCAAGVVWFGKDFDWIGSDLTTRLDVLASNLFIAVVAHILVVFPEGRARTSIQRLLVWAAYALATAGYPISLIGPTAADAVDAIAALVALGVIADLVRRWRLATAPGRRALAPVVWTGPFVVAVVISLLVLDAGGPWPGPVEDAAHWAALVFAALPLAFLAGLLRMQLHRGAVADLVVRLSGPLTPDELQRALAQALGDDYLRIGYWLPAEGRYVDAVSDSMEPHEGPGRRLTFLQHDHEPLAVLEHDASLDEERGLIEAVAAAARLALENARLQAELRAQLGEVRASRARIVAAGVAERRRIERDLHDGVQQRLLAIRLSLRLLHGQLVGERQPAAEVEELLHEAEQELAETVDELRTLARGLHPAVLADEGLGAALEALARRAAIPVTLAALPSRRLPPQIEAVAYFVAAEAVANATKHAEATELKLSACETGDVLVVEITDDGIGGAAIAPDGGLAGLSDRVAALNGALVVNSPPGSGTQLRAQIPLPT